MTAIPTLDEISEPSFLDDVLDGPIERVREVRNGCRQVETGLSYLRRMVQGRLDIVATELHRRAELADGAEEADLHDIIDRLPEVLAEKTRSGGSGGRIPDPIHTGEVDQRLADQLDDIAPPSVLSDPVHLDEETLSRLVEELSAFERAVSDHRRTLFERIDVLEAELIRRYKTGEATVDGLLR